MDGMLHRYGGGICMGTLQELARMPLVTVLRFMGAAMSATNPKGLNPGAGRTREDDENIIRMLESKRAGAI